MFGYFKTQKELRLVSELLQQRAQCSRTHFWEYANSSFSYELQSNCEVHAAGASSKTRCKD